MSVEEGELGGGSEDGEQVKPSRPLGERRHGGAPTRSPPDLITPLCLMIFPFRLIRDGKICFSERLLEQRVFTQLRPRNQDIWSRLGSHTLLIKTKQNKTLIQMKIDLSPALHSCNNSC